MDLITHFCSILCQFAMLQEMAEEWEQCEHKLKESRDWSDKSRTDLNSMANKKRPIRDQVSLRERMLADISVQRTKVVMAVEKLKVHFDNADSGSAVNGSSNGEVTERDVNVMGRAIESDLDALQAEIKEQIGVLEQCLAQLDQYQQVHL